MILEVLKGKDPVQKKRALQAIAPGQLAPQEALELKKLSMSEPRSELGLLAFTALGRAGDLDAIKKLMALLKDPSIHTRLAAARSLIFTGTACIESILEVLEGADEETLAPYIDILRRVPKGDSDEFIRQLQAGPPNVKVVMARVLGSFGANEKTVVALIKSLSSVDSRMTDAVTQSLVDVGAKVLPILNKLVPSSPPRVVEILFTIMSRIGEPAKALIQEAMASPLGHVKRAAARALHFAADEKTYALLAAALGDKDALLAENASLSLVAHLATHRDRLKRTFRESKSKNQQYWLLRIFHHDIDFYEEQLLLMFRSDKAPDRALAVASVPDPHNALIYNRLVEALNDEDFHVRELAIDKLVILSVDRLPDLIKALGDSRAGVIDGVIETLRRLGEKAVDHLIELINRGNDQQKINAANALGLLGNKKAIPPLRGILLAGNDWVRQYALGALGALGDTDTLLKIISKGPEDNRKMAMRAISGAGLAALMPLLQILRETKPDAREGVAQTIMALGEPVKAKVQELIEAEGDENIRFWLLKIQRALGKKHDLG